MNSVNRLFMFMSGLLLMALLFLPCWLTAQPFKLVNTLHTPTSNTISGLVFTAANKTIIGGDSRGQLCYWDVAEGYLSMIMGGHSNGIIAMDIDHKGHRLATLGGDNKIALWNSETGKKINTLKVENAHGGKLVFSREGDFLFFMSNEIVYKIRVDDLKTVDIYKIPNNSKCLISADRRFLVCNKRSSVELLDLGNKAVTQNLKVCKGRVESFDEARGVLACLCGDEKIYIYENQSEGFGSEPVKSFKSKGGVDIALSPDGRFAVASTGDGALKVWDLDNPRKKYLLKGHDTRVSTYTFSPDMQLMATASRDGAVMLRNTGEKKEEPVEEEEAVAKKEAPEIIYAQPNLPESIDGRIVERQENYEVTSSTLEVYVWDDEKVDGDTISLLINDKWVLENYRVTKTRKKITIDLVPGPNNYLVLYAHNLGSNPPNTAAISFNDGKKERIITLNSDLRKCGAVNFVYTK